MYVYRTIPYIPKSKEELECVNGAPGLIYFFRQVFFASGLLGCSCVHSLPSSLQALLRFPDDKLSFWKLALWNQAASPKPRDTNRRFLPDGSSRDLNMFYELARFRTPRISV